VKGFSDLLQTVFVESFNWGFAGGKEKCFELFEFCLIFLAVLMTNVSIRHASGWVVSSTLAGATVGSFTGGSLADKIGRRRTFQLDAIPLLIGTLLRSLLFCLFLFFSTYVFIPELLTMKKLTVS
jgi:MFS family permease